MPTIQIESDQLLNAARQMPEDELRQFIAQLMLLEREKNDMDFIEHLGQAQPSVLAAQNNMVDTASTFALQAADDWERLMLELGTDCDVSLSDQALSSEGIYE